MKRVKNILRGFPTTKDKQKKFGTEGFKYFSVHFVLSQKVFCYSLGETFLTFPAGIYLFEVNNGNTRTMCEICSKLTIKTPEQYQWSRYGVFIVNFEQISDIALVFPWLTLNK